MNNDSISPAGIIKKETALAHATTEKALIVHIKNIHTVDDYAALLTCMHKFYKPMEQHFDQLVAPLLTDYNSRRKADRLEQDLTALGKSIPQQQWHSLPVMQSPTQALACSYVLEGSTLGGAVIKKIIQSQCPAIPATAFSFFGGYGEANKTMWMQFVDQFNKHITTPEQVQEAVVAANDCFVQLGENIVEHYS